MSRRQPVATRPTSWKRLTIVTLAIFWGLAAVVLLVSEVVLPQIAGASSPGTSGVNYGAMFGSNFLRPFGLIIAVALVVLGPVALLFRGADELGERLRVWVRRGEK
jgi:hypothetical protein